MSGRRNRFVCWPSLSITALGLLLLPSAAQAQVRYVSSSGGDASPCTSAAAPCRTLQRALDVSQANGEIRVLDSGDFGTGTIVKSLNITADGATVIGEIVINGTKAVVALRGLDLRGNGNSGDSGIHVVSARAVHIEHCEIEHFGTHGIYLDAPSTKLFVSNSIVRDNGVAGLAVNNSATSTILTIDNSRFENNRGDGILILAGLSLFSRTTVSGNYANGINLSGGTAVITWTTAANNGASGYFFPLSSVTLASSSADGNKIGVEVGSTAVVTLTDNAITNNRYDGIRTNGALVRTRGSNTVIANSPNVRGTLTPIPEVSD